MGVGDVTKCTIIGNIGRDVFNIVLHYETAISIGNKQAEYDGLFDALSEVLFYKQLTNDALDFCSEKIDFTEMKFRDVDDDTVGADYAITPTEVGKRGADRLPPQTAFLVRKRTGVIGRSAQGRNYWPFGDEGVQVGGNWEENFVSDVGDWSVTLIPLVNLTGQFAFELVIYSETYGTVRTVTQTESVNRTATQRRRND